MSLANYGESALLQHLFKIAAYTQPTIYLGVSTTAPAEDGTGVTEPVGNGYARIATAGTDWQEAAGTVDNINALSFAEATGSWGTLSHFVMYDAPTAGNLIASSALTATKAVSANDTLRFPVGAITFSMD